MRSSLSLSVLKSRLSNHRTKILFGLILLLAGILRIYKLDERCLFGDEVLTLNLISGSNWQEVWHNVVYGLQGDLPLYYVILHFWSQLSKDASWLRVFSTLMSLLSLLVTYKLCLYLFDRRVALLAIFLRAISPLRILYAQTVRYYSLNSFLNILSLYFFIKAVRSNARARWFLYVAARVASIYVNYSSLLFLFAEGTFIWLYDRKYPSSSKRWLVCVLIILVLCFPIGFYFFRDFDTVLSGEGFTRVPLRYGFIANFLYALFSFSLGKTVSPFNYPVVIAAAVVYLFVIAYFLKAYFLKSVPRESSNFLLLVMLVAVSLCSLSKYNSPRYILSAGTMFGIIVSLGILKAPRQAVVALAVAVSLLRFYSLYNLYTERQYHRKEMVDDWDDIAAYVKSSSESGGLVVHNSHAFAYYFKESGCDAAIASLPEADEDMPLFIQESFEPHKNSPRVIFVDSPLSGLRIERYKYEVASLRNWLKQNKFRLLSSRGFDKERFAEDKRKLLSRPFPEYRTTVYIYEKYR